MFSVSIDKVSFVVLRLSLRLSLVEVIRLCLFVVFDLECQQNLFQIPGFGLRTRLEILEPFHPTCLFHGLHGPPEAENPTPRSWCDIQVLQIIQINIGDAESPAWSILTIARGEVIVYHCWLVVWLPSILFSSSQLTNIFQRGSNHQPDCVSLYLQILYVLF